MKRLVLFVEGAGDFHAAPVLVNRVLTEINARESVFLDPKPFKVGNLPKLVKREQRRTNVTSSNWIRHLSTAAKQKDLGGVLLLLDGDTTIPGTAHFCAAEVAAQLAKEARAAGAGSKFSVAVVFACKEFESWLIAGVESLAGGALPDGRPGINAGVQAPDGNLEEGPRGAKEWLSKRMASGYSETLDQKHLTNMVDLDEIRIRMRSFRRFESAINQLVQAVRNDEPTVSP